MGTEREVVKIVVVGHVDHGKSTVIGRLLYDTKSIPEGAIDRVKRISKEKGKPFEYAYLLDAFEEEQKQGITIDTTQLQFKTEQRDYVIIDAPGHKEFLKNMISGAANAEAALLIIDAYEGIQEQSKRHGYILSLLGIQKVYVLVNKMDLIGYSEGKFNDIKQAMNEFLNNLNVYPLKYIPISAFFGENMTATSDQMPWYKGEPIIQAIDLFEKDTGLEDKPLRFPIQDVYKFDHRRIIAGRIEAGQLAVGDEILILPSNRVTKVKTIEHWAPQDQRQTVSAGMSVGITVEDEFFNQRGEVISHVEDGRPLVSDRFKANLFWLGKKALVKQKDYILKLATQEMECEIFAITKVIDATTLETLEDAKEIKTNDAAEVIIKTKKPICFDEFKHNQNTGRFVIVDGYDVCGGGIVSGLPEEIQTSIHLVKNDREVAVEIFDEYFYLLNEKTIRKVPAKARNFSVGDIVPISGQTYEYPSQVDILDAKSGLVALIRKAKLHDIVRIDKYDYEFDRAPLINDKGDFLRVGSNETLARYITEWNELSDLTGSKAAAFANKWSEFGGFRRIRFLDSVKTLELEYHL